jgi:hypothetical protein
VTRLLTKEQAIVIAEAAARENGWAWLQPVAARLRRTMVLFGALRWEIRSNAESIGGNVLVVIDDKSAELISSVFLPR